MTYTLSASSLVDLQQTTFKRRVGDAGRNDNYLSRPGQPDPLSNQIGAMVGLARKTTCRALMYAMHQLPAACLVFGLNLQLGPLLYIMLAQGVSSAYFSRLVH